MGEMLSSIYRLLRNFAVVCTYNELPSGLLQKPSLFIGNNEHHALPRKHWIVLYFPKQET